MWGTNDTVANNSNVTVYTLDSTANSQKWIISKKLNKVVISIKADTSFELDYYRGSTNFGNATMYKHGSDMTDAQVEITGTASSCKIKNVASGHYLTTETTATSSNVKWLPLENTNRQAWSIEIISGGTDPSGSKKLTMPACHNQKFNGYSRLFNAYACSSCSVAHIAEFYKGSAYANSSLETTLINAGVISSTNYNAVWSKCPYGKIGTFQSISSTATLYSKVREEINAGRPVIIREMGGDGVSHYVVAYGYEGAGNTDSLILVLDSANLSEGAVTEVAHPEFADTKMKITTAQNGRRVTLKDSLDYNSCTYYATYATTSR